MPRILGVGLFCLLLLSGDLAMAAEIQGLHFPPLFLDSPHQTGEAVWWLQSQLKALGYRDEPADGVFDAPTAEEVRCFQEDAALKPDGRMESADWQELVFGILPVSASASVSSMSIEIDVAWHILILYENGQEVERYEVGIGKSSTPSPLGEWRIISKQRDWGNGFGTRWIGLNVPWGIYGIHGTNRPESIGYSQSHGCIRMRNAEVEDLYERISVGTRVKIMENGRLFPAYFEAPELSLGDFGQHVVYLQSRLKEIGLVLDYADGRFGRMTELAVRYFQAWNGLEITGVAESATYQKLGMLEET